MATFGLYADEQRARDDRALVDPMGAPDPTMMQGLGEAVGKGVMRGGAKAAQAGVLAASAPFALYDRVTGARSADSVFSLSTTFVEPAIEHWTPAPSDVGSAGRILGGFSEIVLPLMAGGGNPVPLMGAMGLSEGADLVKQGASPGASAGVATISAATLGLGFKIPFLGQTLAQRLAFGVGSNVGMGAVQRGASRAVLDASGAPKSLAERYDAFDIEALAVDALAGAVFGGFAHLVTPEVRDATLTANNAKHLEVDVAPGRPIDDVARTAHAQAMETATRQLLRGEPVNVGDVADRLAFEPSPAQDGALGRFLQMVRNVTAVELPAATVGRREPAVVARARTLDPARMASLSPGDVEFMNVARSIVAEDIGDRLGGVSHLRGIIESLARVYMRDGPERGRMMLDERAADAPASSGFFDEVATPGFLDELHAEITRETAAMVQQAAPPVRTPETPTAPMREGADPGSDRTALAAAPDDNAFAPAPEERLEASGTVDRPAGPEDVPARTAQAEAERAAADQVVVSMPDLEVVGPGGELMSARELLEWADSLEVIAKQEATAIEAAVNCFLRT